MGCWSVYCSISKIAITAGHECVFIPLKKSKGNYLPYLPAALPIFGSYDDYGGIEDIIEDENTKILENYFGLSIYDFCSKIIIGHGDSEDEDEEESDVKDFKSVQEEMTSWTYMWVDKKVYDFIIANRDHSFGGVGSLSIGKKEILEYLGFTYLGESEKNPTYDPKRYKHLWEFGDKTFYSDGSYLYSDKSSVFYLTGKTENSLDNYIDIPEEKLDIANKYQWELWRMMKEEDISHHLFWIIGVDGSTYSHKKFMRKMLAKMTPEESKKYGYEEEKKTLTDIYIENVNLIGDSLAHLLTIRHNLHCMSGSFAPYEQFLTPQCGEFESHQALLEGFAKINNSYIREEED